MKQLSGLTCLAVFLLISQLSAQPKSWNTGTLLAGEAPPIEKVSRVAARIAQLEDSIAAMLSAKTSQPGPAGDVQDVKIGLRVVALRWYEFGQKAGDPASKAQITLRADLVFNHLSMLDSILDGLLAPSPTNNTQALPEEKDTQEKAHARKLAALAKLAETFNKQVSDPPTGDNSVALGNTLAGLIGVLASNSGTVDLASLAALQPGKPTTSPSLEEQQAKLSEVDPVKLLAAVQASSLAIELKRQFSDLINMLNAAMAKPESTETAVTCLELLQDNLLLAETAGRSMWLPQATRDTLFKELQKGLALFKYAPTRNNGLARLSKAKDIAKLIRTLETLPLTEEQKVGLGNMLNQAIQQQADMTTQVQGQEALNLMNNFAQVSAKVYSTLADVRMSKPLESSYQTLLKHFEEERTSAARQFALLAPLAARPDIEKMNAIAGDLELLKGMPGLLEQIKPFAGKLYANLENSVKDAAMTLAKPEADHALAVSRLRDFIEAQNLVNEYAAVRLGDDQAALPAVQELSAGQYFAVIKLTESNLSDLFKALATAGNEPPPTPKPVPGRPNPPPTNNTVASELAVCRKRQKDLNKLLGDLQLAITAKGFAEEMKSVGAWAEIEFDPAVEGMNRRFYEAVTRVFENVAKPPVAQMNVSDSVKILDGYRPWLKIECELIRNYAPRLRQAPRGPLGFIVQLYRPTGEPGRQSAREALGNPQWAMMCYTVNEAAYCDSVSFVDHAITHLKTLEPQSKAPRPRAPRPGR